MIQADPGSIPCQKDGYLIHCARHQLCRLCLALRRQTVRSLLFGSAFSLQKLQKKAIMSRTDSLYVESARNIYRNTPKTLDPFERWPTLSTRSWKHGIITAQESLLDGNMEWPGRERTVSSTSTFQQVSFGGVLGPNRFQLVTCEVGAGQHRSTRRRNCCYRPAWATRPPGLGLRSDWSTNRGRNMGESDTFKTNRLESICDVPASRP